MMNQPLVLTVLGFFIGGVITLTWELKGSPSGQPAAAEADLTSEEDTRPVTRSVERLVASSHEPLQEPYSIPQMQQDRRKTAPQTQSPPAIDKKRVVDPEGTVTAKSVRSDPTETSPSLPVAVRASGTDRSVSIQVNRILVGGQLVSHGILDASVIERYGDEKKYIVYFDLSVIAEGNQPEVLLTHEDFRLEDSQGTIYQPLEMPGQLSAVLEQGERGRGCIAYAIHNDGAPAQLYFRTRDESYTPLPTRIFERGSSGSESRS